MIFSELSGQPSKIRHRILGFSGHFPQKIGDFREYVPQVEITKVPYFSTIKPQNQAIQLYKPKKLLIFS